MMSLERLGNSLYSGERTIDVVGHRRRWYALSAGLIILALIGLGVRGLNLGLEFRGGSEFRVSAVQQIDGYEATARDAVRGVLAGASPNITRIGGDTVRVQTAQLTDTEGNQVRLALAQAFDVPDTEVSASFVGPSWGASVSTKALQALAWFLVLVSLAMALYFRTWKMAVAALVALFHDVLITVGIYALIGFEVSPASVIGFLTILGYSLYDTVVVFDKVRDNTSEAFGNGRLSFAAAANLAVNQTLVRSINTSVSTLLPIGAILAVGVFVLGPGTLLDLALALFVGVAVGTYSSIVIATPLLVSLRSEEERVLELDKRAERHAARVERSTNVRTPGQAATSGAPGAPAAAQGAPATMTGRQVHKYAQTGPRNQPRRPPRSKR